MAVTSNAFLSDTIKWIRDDLITGVTDPISTSRGTNEKFVLTAYPTRPVRYPIITITDINTTSTKLGMSTHARRVDMIIEVRIWATKVTERDDLYEQVYKRLTSKEHESGGLIDQGLHDWDVTSAVNVTEPGKGGIKSKVIEFKLLFITITS